MDYIYLFEEEEGTSPFTYRLDTKGINEGEHILTVNIYSHSGRVASKSRKFNIRRSE